MTSLLDLLLDGTRSYVENNLHTSLILITVLSTDTKHAKHDFDVSCKNEYNFSFSSDQGSAQGLLFAYRCL